MDSAIQTMSLSGSQTFRSFLFVRMKFTLLSRVHEAQQGLDQPLNLALLLLKS